MRDHSSRNYNKKKVVRFRVKSSYRADGPQANQRQNSHLNKNLYRHATH